MFDIENYHRVFSKYPKCLMESSGRVYGQFFIGNRYKREIPYYGAYPPSYLKRVKALFPNLSPIIHIFGGTVTPEEGEVTIDINPDMNPTICCEATEVDKYFPRNSFKFLLLDPPYSKTDAIKYGYAYPNKKMVLRAARKIATEDAVLIWLDVSVPIFRKIEWELLGMIGVFTGTNRILRSATIFKASKDEIYDDFIQNKLSS